MSIETAITALQGYALACGAKGAPDRPPESGNQFPFAICYERSGHLAKWITIHNAVNQATIHLEYHVARILLPQAVTAAMTFRDAFLDCLIPDYSLGGAVGDILEVRYTFGGMKYADIDTIGYQFEIDVEVIHTV